MIDIREQEEMLIALGNMLEKKISCYAIGGTAMMLKGIKDSTLDLDFVFDKGEDREEFIAALRKLGAKESDVVIVYGIKENTPIMLELGKARFDLFTNKIITSVFSQNMKERAKEIHEFGKNLIIMVADVHDLIIMKGVTSRQKDIDDIITVFKKSRIGWNIILKEAEEQVKLGNEKAILSIGEKFEILRNQKIIDVPLSFLDDLFNLLRKQVKGKSKEKKKRS